MEDIVRKLTRKKPFLVHQAYTKLLSIMLEKKKNGTKFTRMSEEVVLLKNQCLSSTLSVSQGAFNILLACVQHDLLTTPDVLTVLTSLAAQNKNLSQILHTIIALHNKPEAPVVGSTLGDTCKDIPNHALVYVLKQCGDGWKPLLDIISAASSSSSWRLNSLDYFLPVFSYILCTRNSHLTRAAKQCAWQLLSRLTIERPQLRILMDHFIWFQSSIPDDLTEEISFLGHIYRDIIARYPSFCGLFLLYYVNLLLTSLENNENTELLWQHIEYLTTKVLAYRLDIDIACPPSPLRHMVNVTMREIVPVSLLLLVQCVPHCDQHNLKQLLSTSQTLIRYFSIHPALSCSFLAPLLPWLSALSNKSSATSSDPRSSDPMSSDLRSSDHVDLSVQLKRDVEVFVEMIVTSLKPPPVVPTKKASAVSEEEEEESEDDFDSDLVYFYSDEDYDTEENEEMLDTLALAIVSLDNANEMAVDSKLDQTANPLRRTVQSNNATKKTDQAPPDTPPKKLNASPSQKLDHLLSPSEAKDSSRPAGSHIVEHRRIREDETRSYLNSGESEWNRGIETIDGDLRNDPEWNRGSETLGRNQGNDPQWNRGSETLGRNQGNDPQWNRGSETMGGNQGNDPQWNRGSETLGGNQGNDPQWNRGVETNVGNETWRPMSAVDVDVDVEYWRELDGKDEQKTRREEMGMWEVEWKRMLAGTERVVAAQRLIRKLNKAPVDSWSTAFDNSPGSASLVSGFLAAYYVHPSPERFDKAKEKHSKAWDFVIAQEPCSSLYLLLYLLAREKHPYAIQHWLERIVSTAHDNENIPTILATLESLKRPKDPILTSLLIPLYAQLYILVPRGTFPFLLPLLTENASRMKPFEYDVLRAHAARYVLQHARPELHGKELVPLLSSLMSTYSDPQASTAPVTLSLEAIRELCRAGVVDFASVWASLGVLRHDSRPRVLLGLIGLMECAVPDDTPSSGTDTCCSELSLEISGVLWSYVAQNISVEVTGAAFRALSRYNFTSDYPLKHLHPSFRANLKIPKALLGKLRQNTNTPEEHIMFIPGECFLNLLDRVDCTSARYHHRDCCLYRYHQQGSPIYKSATWYREEQPRAQLPLDPFQCRQHALLMGKMSSGEQLSKADFIELDKTAEAMTQCAECKWSDTPPFYKPYSSFLLLMRSCIEHELKSYREIIYNSPYQDQSHREPSDYSYLPYKSLLRALVKFLQAKLEAGPSHMYLPQTLLVLDLLSSSYSKPLPPLNWSFLLNAYLKPNSAPSQSKPASPAPSETNPSLLPSNSASSESKPTTPPITAQSETRTVPAITSPSPLKIDSSPCETNPAPDHSHWCGLQVLQIAASYCGSSQETSRTLSHYLSTTELVISQVTALTYHLPSLCEHLDSTVFQRFFDTYLKPEYQYFVDQAEETCRGVDPGQTLETKKGPAPLRLEDQCTRPDCTNPFALLNIFQGIRDCFTKLGPKLSGLHLPPANNLEANMLYLCSYVKEILTLPFMLYSENYELFSQVLHCTTLMPPIYHAHLISPLEATEAQNDVITLLKLRLVKEKKMGPSMHWLNEAYLSCDLLEAYLVPDMLQEYSRAEVVHFILQEVFPDIIGKKKAGEHIFFSLSVLLLSLFAVSPLSHLLATPVARAASLLYAQKEHHYDFFTNEEVYSPMEDLFPVAFAALLSPEQYDQAVTYLTTILDHYEDTRNKANDYEDEYKVLFYRTLLALKSHISSEKSRLNVLSINVVQ